ncbi:MAG TPA: copper resistance protein CopC [Acidimicrobiales bacterium]|nr:copper resistance protein CopC [Acidimicrobiales bacterium]
MTSGAPDRGSGRRTRGARLAAGVAVVVMGLLVTAAPASAHAQLESTYPDQSSVLLTSPGRVELHFGEPVEIDFGSIRVLGPDGRRVDHGGTRHPAGDPDSVVTTLPAHLADGSYVVAWRVVSADSHPVHGAYLFSIGNAGTGAGRELASALAGSGGYQSVGVVAGVVRVVVLAALLLLVGVAAMVVALAPRTGRRRVGVLLWGAWAALVAGTVAGTVVQGAYAAALPLGRAWSWPLVRQVLGTRFGQVQVLRLVLLAAFVPVLLAVTGRIGAGPRGRWLVPGGLVALGLLLTPGLAGHAATNGAAAGIPLDLAHMASASIWVGGISLLAALWLQRGGSDGHVTELGRRFSPWALWAAAVVVASGVVQSVREVGSWYALTNTTFGRTLAVKVALVLVLLGLGACSRRLVRARDARWRWTVMAEVAAVGAVLVATALLVDAVPARQAAALPFVRSFQVLGVQVNAVVQPARVGPGNSVHIYVLTIGGAPKAIPELDATMSLPSAGLGPIALPLSVAGPGHYRASDVDFPQAGNWVLQITVRTTAVDEQQVGATVPVH